MLIMRISIRINTIKGRSKKSHLYIPCEYEDVVAYERFDEYIKESQRQGYYILYDYHFKNHNFGIVPVSNVASVEYIEHKLIEEKN